MKHLRFYFLFFVFALFYASLGANLYNLQVNESDYYINKAEAMKQRSEGLQLRRGRIFIQDKSGIHIQIAQNKDYPIIFLAPNEIENPERVSTIVAEGLGADKEEVYDNIISNKENSFRILVEKASAEQVAFVSEKKLEGVHIEFKQYRFYPLDFLASHVVGYVGMNAKNPKPTGLYGIERFYDEKLSKGDDVYLTIDANIQSASEQTLAKLMEKYGATGGTVIVQNPNTGAIIAMANKPDFNPNEYSEFNVKNFLNPAVQSQYEPGSVFKPLTMSAGIDMGVLGPKTRYTDKGFVTLNGKTIRNAQDKVYGSVTMTEVIENSINTGAVYAEQLLGHENFYDYVKKFGFAEKTGIGLPEEISGDAKNLTNKGAKAIDFATASFGQGVAVTPIQLVGAFSAFANGGLLMKPYIDANEKPYVVRRVIDEETAKQVNAMLESTVEKAKIASISQYRVAGKTGTALIPEKGKYSDEMIHTFVGFAPARNPQFTILVKLDRPQIGELAGLTVVPAFRELSEFVINYYTIPPDNLKTNEIQ